MKKKLGYLMTPLLAISMFLVPNYVKADIEATGLKAVIEDEVKVFGNAEGYSDRVEELKNTDLGDYKEEKGKVNVYLFRGSSCGHCFDAVEFFAGIAKDYQDKFNLVSYEVWGNKDNSELMEQVAKKLGDDVGGVPYIIVGKKSWNGYTDSYGEEIKTEIDKQINKDKADRYDVMKEFKNKDNSSNDVVALLLIIIVTAGIVTGVIFTRKNA